MTASAAKYWLLKAEPDSRIVKGKDVKFSVDDFESVKTSPWEGVRNYEARNLMKEMRLQDLALFYHSNCKNPGIAAFAEVSTEAYPDHTAWDASHPYFDPKSNADNPKWFMVDLTFVSRAEHFIPLALLRYISEASELPSEIAYIGEAGHAALKNMDLVTRGRLSVQRVDEKAWDAITLLASKGGWDELDLKGKKRKTPPTVRSSRKAPAQTKATRMRTARAKPATREERPLEEEADDFDDENTEDRDDDGDYEGSEAGAAKKRGAKRRKKGDSDEEEYGSLRRTSAKARR